MSEQFIYLLRHAKAEERTVPRADVDRCLVEKGRQQAMKVGRFLRAQQLLPDLVLTSPYPRALQTAMLVADSAECSCQPQEAWWLSHGQSAQQVAEQFAAALPQWPQRTLLVGHEPELSQLLGTLLQTEAACWHIRKATLVCLQVSSGLQYRLEWCLPVNLLR